MTRENILALPAGPQMDGQLAESFMNYPACLGGASASFTVEGYDPIWLAGPNQERKTCPAYSTEAAPCLELVAVLNKTLLLETQQYWVKGGHRKGVLGFKARFRLFTQAGEETDWAPGTTLMEAIGRAALLWGWPAKE